jgi:uncharacterized protein (TIGR02646 family)
VRPVRRNNSPITGDYAKYQDAKTVLISRIGAGWIGEKHSASYCSYCERVINTNLAVEHIEPKGGEFGQPLLAGGWHNFLLACVNCNSTKGDKQVILDEIFLPDRDNTFAAFEYQAGGDIKLAEGLGGDDESRAEKTLKLVGLDKAVRETYDEEGRVIAQDRRSQRMDVWGVAETSLADYLDFPQNLVVQRLIVNMMVFSGFFSVWMTVFKDYPAMKNRFINAMAGTKESECFDLVTGVAISPHPNRDGLQGGGKI